MKKEKLPTMTWHGRNKIIKMSKTLKLQSEIAQPLGESIFFGIAGIMLRHIRDLLLHCDHSGTYSKNHALFTQASL